MNAKRFEPAVVWRSTNPLLAGTPAEYQFPGDASEKCPDGFVPVSLASLRAHDKFVRDYNSAVRRSLNEEREWQRIAWDQRIARRRADALRRVWHNPKALALLKACEAYVDAKRARKYAQAIEPNFHNQAVSFDASNRQGHASAETGWKDKKA